MVSRVRVGILNDMGDGPDAPGEIIDWLDREIRALQSAVRGDTEV